jgi:4-amino-4-deoxy-L-arabinose transferase-like glycosyltransferase
MRVAAVSVSGRLVRSAWIWVIPVLLLTFWLGARDLNATPLWSDELSSVRDAGGPLFGPLSPLGVWRRVAEGNPWHAPGYFLSLNVWTRLSGWETGAARALSLFYGLLAVAMTYRLGRDTVSSRAGVIAALVLATSMAFVHYESKLRMYTLIALVTVAFVWLYLRIITMSRPPTRAWWVALALLTTIALYTHYLAILSLGAVGLYHVLFVAKNKRWLQVVLVVVLGALPFLLWVPALTTGVGLVGEDGELHAISLSAPDLVWRMVSLFANTAPLLFVLALIPGLLRPRREIYRVLLITLLLLGILLVANELFQIISHRRLRYLLGLWPLLSLLVGAGIDALGRRHWVILGASVWLAVGVGNVLLDTTTPILHGHTFLFPFQRVIYYIDSINDGDVVVNVLPAEGRRSSEYETVASYYFAQMDLEYLIAQPGDDAQQADLTRLLAPRERIWLAYIPSRLPALLPDLTSWLGERYVVCRTTVDDNQLRVSLYARSEAQCL